MKTLNWLTICFIVCCLFTSNVFACFTGINPNIQGHLNDPLGPPANTVTPGDTIYYEVYISLPSLNCFTYDISGQIITPDGVPHALPPINDMNPGDTQLLGIVATYVVDAADMGTNGALPGQINAHVQLDGTHITSDNPYLEAPAEGSANYPSVVLLTPCVSVDKDACEYSKVGDEVVYNITITNCGLQDLNLVSVTDSLLGDITAVAAGAGCDPLPVGESCNFQVLREVQPTDPDLLVNIVEVNYSSAITQETVTDTDDAVVTLLHPSFTQAIQCVEIVDDTALFEVTFCNTGDVGLMVDPQDIQIPPFPLPVPVDSECSVFYVEAPVEQAVCGAGSATKTIAALASILLPPDTPEECLLGNIITPDPIEASATCTAEVNPNFTAEKVCLDTSPLDVADGFADFQINFTNTGDVPLLFEIDDPSANGYHSIEGPIAPGDSGSVTVSVPAATQVGCPADDVSNAATVTGICLSDGSPVRTDSVETTCPGVCADFDVEKTCLTTSGLTDGSTAEYGIVITNTGTVPLDLVIDDPSAEPPLAGVPITLGPGETYSTTVTRTVVCGEPGEYTIENTVSVVAVAPDGTQIGPKTSTAECPYECGGAEGCTPGYWKNHPDCWCDTYVPEMLVSDVFTRLASAPYDTLGDDEKPLKSDFNTDTLMDTLKYRGGPDLAGSVRNLLRHAVSALLNGCSNDVMYPVSDTIVIELVNSALESEDPAIIQELHLVLAGFNEDYPCPINAHCERIEPIVY